MSTGVTGLFNHGSAQGDTVVLGNATAAGQVLTFALYDPPSSFPTVTWFSNPAMNSDTLQHLYLLAVAGGDAYAGSPAGTFVSWEDRGPGGDWDYNDDAFIFTGVTPSVLTSGVPLASTWAMMLAGFGGLGLAALRGARGRARSLPDEFPLRRKKIEGGRRLRLFSLRPHPVLPPRQFGAVAYQAQKGPRLLSRA